MGLCCSFSRGSDFTAVKQKAEECTTGVFINKYKGTTIRTKFRDNEFRIDSTENMVVTDLYHVGKRATDASSMVDGDTFYILAPRRESGLDATEILKYQCILNGDDLKFKFMESVGTIFEGQGVNAEGLDIIQHDDPTEKGHFGYLICNDLYCSLSNNSPNNSHLWYVDNDLNVQILVSLHDRGVAELNGICTLKDFGKNGYLVLPQSLNLGVIGDDGKVDWSAFENWCLTNQGDASIFYVDRQAILDKINEESTEKQVESTEKQFESTGRQAESTTEREALNAKTLEFERISVRWEDTLGSEESLFFQFPFNNAEEGYVVEGFEAMEVDEDGNIVMVMEYSKHKDTFDVIMVARFEEKKDGELGIVIDPCHWVKVENNGGGENYSQEALLLCKV